MEIKLHMDNIFGKHIVWQGLVARIHKDFFYKSVIRQKSQLK